MDGDSDRQQGDTASIHVRVLMPEDAELYRAIRLRALQESPPAFGSVPEDEPDLVATAAKLRANDDQCFFGAFEETRLIGIVRLSRHTAPNERHRAYLGGLYVLKPFRGHGCGRALICAALDKASAAPGVRRINLSVVTGQKTAVRLYESLGFRIYGTEQEAFSRAGQFYDERLMTLVLPSALNLSA